MTKARTATGTALVRAGEQLTTKTASPSSEEADFERFVSLLNCYDRKTKPVRPYLAFVPVFPAGWLANASNPLEAEARSSPARAAPPPRPLLCPGRRPRRRKRRWSRAAPSLTEIDGGTSTVIHHVDGLRCTRDVKEVHTAVCRHSPSSDCSLLCAIRSQAMELLYPGLVGAAEALVTRMHSQETTTAQKPAQYVYAQAN